MNYLILPKKSLGQNFLTDQNVINKIINIINIENKTILEIGSGDGYFIDECNIANIDITGSEAYHKSFLRLQLNYGEK